MSYSIVMHCIVFFFLFSSSIFADPVPDFIEALNSAPFAASTPANDPDGWLLAHVDAETTGLVPGYHEMIDVGRYHDAVLQLGQEVIEGPVVDVDVENS